MSSAPPLGPFHEARYWERRPTMATFHMAHLASTALRFERFGAAVIRYGLALIIVWIGALKFATYEAAAIEGLVANSPLLSWMYRIASVPTVAAVIGVVEIVLGCLIAIRSFAPRLSAIGSLGAILMFLTTLSFMVSTPGCGSRTTGSRSCPELDSSWSRTCFSSARPSGRSATRCMLPQ